jgi:hypothetical protein
VGERLAAAIDQNGQGFGQEGTEHNYNSNKEDDQHGGKGKA